MSKILVTGAAGFLGAHICEELLDNDHEVIALVSFNHRGCPLRLEPLKDRLDRIVYHDLRASISPRQIADWPYPDFIIHAAAESHVDRSIEEPKLFILNNILATTNVLEYARDISLLTNNQYPKLLLQVTTDEVYGPAKPGQSHKPWSSIRPSNPYSASKACQEAICYSYWRTFKTPTILMNTMNLFGSAQDREKLIPKAIRCAMTGEEMPIFGSADGKSFGTRMWLHARSFANALRWRIETPLLPAMYPEAEDPERWHVAGQREVSNMEMVELIEKFTGKTINKRVIDFHSSRSGHDMRYALDSSAIREAGWIQPGNFEEDLKATVEWTVNNPRWWK